MSKRTRRAYLPILTTLLATFASTAYGEAKVAAWNLAGFFPIAWDNLYNAVEVVEKISPDVLVLVEVNPNLAAGALVAGLHFKGHCYEYHVPEQPRANQEIALLNKCGVSVFDVGLIPGSDLGRRGYREALHARVKVREFDFVLVGLHLKAGRGSTNRGLRDQQAEIISDWIATSLAGHEKDVIVVGDYNMIPAEDDSNFRALSDGILNYVSSSELPSDSWSHISGDGNAGNLLDGYAISAEHTTEYVADSVEILRTDDLLGMNLTEFRDDVSDHRPLVALFDDSTDDD